eukprot:Em0006g902a
MCPAILINAVSRQYALECDELRNLGGRKWGLILVDVQDILKAYAGRSQGRKRARDQDASNVGKWVIFLVIVQNEGHYFGERTPRNGVRDPEQDRTVFVCQVRWKDRKPRSRLVPLENYLEGKGVSVRCAHGDINFYPLAKVEIVAPRGDVSPRRPDRDDEGKGAAATRGRKEKERAAGARPRSIEESSNGSPTLSSASFKMGRPCHCQIEGFYWPNVFGDVEEFCRTCAICQKASHKRVGKAPLMPLPVISEPFSRVAMDIVGPLLTSREEAIPLKNIDAEHVAEKLVELFARDKSVSPSAQMAWWSDLIKRSRACCEAGLTVKVGKCQFGTSKCVDLGHMVDYASQAAPLTDLTRKSAPNTVKWTRKCNEAFETLKQCLCSGPVLRSPDFDKTFVLQTDASDRGVGAVLSQLSDDGDKHPIGYYSRKLLPRVYLLGRKFVIQTDHRSLEWLERLKEGNPKLCRWSLALQPYEYTVEHRAGTANLNADALSRATKEFVAGEG